MAVKSKPRAGTRKVEIDSQKTSEVVSKAATLNLDSVTTQIAKTQVEVQRQLSEVGNALASQLATLETVQAAIAAKQDELKSLHGIEATALTLDDLKGEIEETRAGWAAEEEAREKAEDEAKAEREKRRQREEDQYQYDTRQAHQKAEDEWAAARAQAAKTAAEQAEERNKAWAAREAALAAAEKELADLRKLAADLPETVRKAEEKAVAVATNALKKSMETTALLAAKDAETSLKLAAQETASAKAEVARLSGTIADLQGQLAAAHKSAQTVAEKALDSASGRQSLETLQSSLRSDQAGAPAPSRR